MGQTKTVSGADLGGSMWVVFVAAAAIVAALVYYRGRDVHRAKPIVIASGIVGLLTFVFNYIQFRTGLDTPVGQLHSEDVGILVQPGGVGAVVGLVVAIIAATGVKDEAVPSGRPAPEADG